MHLAKRIVPVRKSDLGLYMWQDESCQLAKVVYMWQNGSCQLEKVVYMCKTVRASSKKWKDGSGLYIAKRFVPARKTGLGLYTTVRASSKKGFGTLHVAKRFVPARTSCFRFYIWQNGSCQRQPASKCGLVFTFGKTCRADFESCFCSYIWQHLSAGFKTWFWPLNFGKKISCELQKGFWTSHTFRSCYFLTFQDTSATF